MPDIPLARSDYFRGVAKEARIQTRNRYFEENPVLTTTQAALISRPGMRRWLEVGSGPIRGIYSQPGSFDSDLFVASGTQIWRVKPDKTVTLIGTLPGPPRTSVEMVATGNIGETPAYLFVTGGSTLMCYAQDGFASGTLTGIPANNDGVRIGDTYYQFTNASVDAGTPAGTVANPWLVALGISSGEAFDNLRKAINGIGTPGTDYSTALIENMQVQAVGSTTSNVTVRALVAGIIGNAIVTTETGAALAWTAGTLTNGGNPTWFPVVTPDDVGIISLGYIASYVVCIPAQGEGINGRFFWIEPGESTIDPLNFATAERAPDPVYQVRVFGDQFWLPGATTTEVWYFTGDFDAPVARLQGVTFDRGTWPGTAVQIKESMVIVDSDGAVFQIAGGLKRISRPDIEERIREAIQFQANS